MQELAQLEIDFHFDGDTQFIDGDPIIVFGERYTGALLVRNPANYQYIALDIQSEDPDMQFTKKEKYIHPNETKIIPFEIETKASRKMPFKLGVQIHGGYVL